MTWVDVLVEGESDVPILREVLRRRFELDEGEHFRVHPHRGRGRLPARPLARPDPVRRGLLDRLPAVLRAYGKREMPDAVVVVVVDADRDDCRRLKADLLAMLDALPERPERVLLRVAVEEIESWIIADAEAVLATWPHANLRCLPGPPHDRVCGAWEALARTLGRRPETCTGQDKLVWATAVAPRLNLDDPPSPSLRALISGLERALGR